MWATSLTEYFGGITKAIVNSAREHLRNLIRVGGPIAPPDMVSVVEPFRRFDFRSARARALALLLAEQGTNGMLERDGGPFDLLANFGADAVCKLFRERDLPKAQAKLSDAPENRFLVHPSRITELRDILRPSQQALFAEPPTGHLVTSVSLQKLRRGDVVGFLTDRRRAIEQLEQDRAESVGLQYRIEAEAPGSSAPAS